jgi:hypothetical protein
MQIVVINAFPLASPSSTASATTSTVGQGGPGGPSKMAFLLPFQKLHLPNFKFSNELVICLDHLGHPSKTP